MLMQFSNPKDNNAGLIVMQDTTNNPAFVVLRKCIFKSKSPAIVLSFITFAFIVPRLYNKNYTVRKVNEISLIVLEVTRRW